MLCYITTLVTDFHITNRCLPYKRKSSLSSPALSTSSKPVVSVIQDCQVGLSTSLKHTAEWNYICT